jgi:uncharacterized protein
MATEPTSNPPALASKAEPIRTCIGTGVKKPKRDMVRLVRLPKEEDAKDFVVAVDPKGKLRGRGANLDTTVEAFDMAVKKNAIERALKLERKLTAAELAQLREDFVHVLSEREFRRGNKPVKLKIKKEQLKTPESL